MTVLSVSQIYKIGSKWEGHHGKCAVSKQTRHWHAAYHASPTVFAHIWEDLHKIDLVEAHEMPHNLFMLLVWVKTYPTTETLSGHFGGITEETCASWVWTYVNRLLALMDKKITWPERWDCDLPDGEEPDPTTFILSVDGIHCLIDDLTKLDGKWWSHKSRHSALAYELDVAIPIRGLYG
ncbi:hypothetical protein ACA910_022073 [Epithemia clementina (nom. ined.)]